jgi:hypothetical protein
LLLLNQVSSEGKVNDRPNSATDMQGEALATFNRELQTLTNATETFAATLPPLVPSGDINVHVLRNQIHAHTLVRMAFINLGIKFSASDISANVRCVEAAIAMIKLLDDVDLVRLEILPPIIAVSAVASRMTWQAKLLLERLADGWASLNQGDKPPEQHGNAIVRRTAHCS